MAALVPGHRALDEQQLALRVDPHDLEVLHRPRLGAEVTGHALALEDVARALVLPGRTGRPVRDRSPVTRAVPRHVVALDDACETLPERGARDIHHLPDLEDVHTDLRAGLEARRLGFGDPELGDDRSALDAGLGEVARHRLRDARRAALAVGDLHRSVAVGAGLLDLGDAVIGDVEHRHGKAVAVLVEEPCHADLAADESETHKLHPSTRCPASRRGPASVGQRTNVRQTHYNLISTSTPAGRSSFISASTVLSVGSMMTIRRRCVLISSWSREVLSACGLRSTSKRSMRVGSGTGPLTTAPVRLAVSTISSADWSISR